MSERYVIGGVGREVGIVDTQGKKFAPFYGDDAVDVKERLDRAIGKLNSGVDTPTGYAWVKMSQAGTQ